MRRSERIQGCNELSISKRDKSDDVKDVKIAKLMTQK